LGRAPARPKAILGPAQVEPKASKVATRLPRDVVRSAGQPLAPKDRASWCPRLATWRWAKHALLGQCQVFATRGACLQPGVWGLIIF